MDKSASSRKSGFLRRLQIRSGQSPSRKTTISTPGASAQPLPTSSTRPPQLQSSRSRSQGQGFLDSALRLLAADERAIIKEFQILGTEDISTAVGEAVKAAQHQKQVCEDKQWQLRIGERTVILREEADKVLQWLDRFTFVGDMVANIDPVHVGLPWAGIRAILEVAVADGHQMAALVTGLDLALHMANRLVVYLSYFTHLSPTSTATTTLEDCLIKMYALVLQFLSTAIKIYRKGYAARTWQALWDPSDIDKFEGICAEWAKQVDIDANNCDRELALRDGDNTAKWRDDLKERLQSLDDIQDATGRLNVKFDLAKLNPLAGATYNAYVLAEEEPTGCLEGTRVELLSRIADWADDQDGKRIFWLCGMAGTGKSTISRTVAGTLHRQSRLGASFFFKKGEGDRGNGSRFFTTVAAQLADVIPALGRPIAAALEADSLLCTRNLQDQFEKLLLQPLRSLQHNRTSHSYVLVIDAMDECDPSRDIAMVLSLLARLMDVPSFHLQVFVTSRPELPIKLGFQRIDSALHSDILLEEVQTLTIEHDIRLYFEHRLEEIKIEDRQRQSYEPLPEDWPEEKHIQALVDMATPLFIFAFTVCRYIAESDPQERLQSILEQQQNMALSGLKKTYLPILKNIISGTDEQQQHGVVTNFRRLVGPIVLLATPLSIRSLARLLGLSLRHIDDTLRPLHSVLSISKDPDVPIRLLHLSFRDFLVDLEVKDESPFWIDQAATHSLLASDCLHLLSLPGILKHDLCGLGKPGSRRAQLSKEQVRRSIAEDTDYACCYWVLHLVESGTKIRDNDEVHIFLKKHFLHWMEALSWLGRLSSIVSHVSALASIVEIDYGSQLIPFLDDAGSFVLQNQYVVDLAPLQLYTSALIFTPRQSIVRQSFEKQDEMQWPSLSPEVPLNWDSELQKLEGTDESVTTVVFSPNGLVVASASNNKTVRLWNATTGEQAQKLEGHDYSVTAVAFSPDGLVLASASYSTVWLWNVTTGEQTQKLEGHDVLVTAVAFSPDGLVLASASRGTVWLWNVTTGEQTQKLEGHKGWVTAVAFSPDGLELASAGNDKTVRLWNATTGEQTQELGSSCSIHSISYTSDGTKLMTNGEVLELTMRELGLSSNDSQDASKLLFRVDWIRISNEDFLWLPFEYRGVCSDFYGDTLAIGQISGAVSFFRFEIC